jgi:hypothetical protein
MTVINPFDFFVEPYAETFPFAYTDELKSELAPYLVTTEPARPLLTAYMAPRSPREAPNTVNFLVDLNARLQREINYHGPHGARRADAGETLSLGLRLVPRFSAGCWSQIAAHLGSPRASSPAI